MKQKWKQSTLAMIGATLLVSPLMTTISNAEENYYSTDDELYDKQLATAKAQVLIAKKSQKDEDVKKAIDTAISLPHSLGFKLEERDAILDSIFLWIDGLSDENAKAKHMIYFVDTAVNRVTETLIEPDYKLAYALVSEMPESKTKQKYITILKETDKTMGKQLLEAIEKGEIELPNQGFDWSRLPSEAFEPYKDVDTGDYLDGYPLAPKPVPKPNPDTLPEGNSNTNIQYKTIGGHCYKVSTTTENGKNPIVKQERMTGSDSAYCSVAFTDNPDPSKPYNFDTVNPAPPGSGMNLNTGGESSNSYFGVGDYSSNQAKVDANVSDLTLQYTLDRTEAEPYFYETDMAVHKDGTITYQQQRDVLFQLAIRSGGKAVEDKERFMILIENKIIVVENKGDKIPVSSFEVILKGFKAQVKAMESKVGQQ